MFVDKYQRVLRSDGKWMKRSNYPIKIPLRKALDVPYEAIYFKKKDITMEEIIGQNISSVGDFFFADQMPGNSLKSALCEYIGKL